MKILHIQASMTSAGNAAYRLSSAMRHYGIDSNVLNLATSVEKDNAFNYKQNKWCILTRSMDRLVRYYRKNGYRNDSYFYSSLPLYGRNISKHSLVQSSDVIYIHWVAGFLSTHNLRDLLKTGKPVFVYMHDMWPFTGGCHHSLECQGYMSGCTRCNMFIKDNRSVSKQLKEKEQIYSKYPNLHFISPSKWMAQCAKKSIPLKDCLVSVIPNYVSDKEFKPIDKNTAKDILNLPKDKLVITFGCQAGQNNPFKGWKYLEEAINMVERNDIQILIYGSGYNHETVEKVKHPIRFMGRVYDETTLSIICNATDLFVTPSLCENFSLVILENILCETPVVGFDTTGIPELVKTGDTGYLAKFKDSRDLAIGIETVINTHQSFVFKKHYSSDEIIRKHMDLVKKFTSNGF